MKRGKCRAQQALKITVKICTIVALLLITGIEAYKQIKDDNDKSSNSVLMNETEASKELSVYRIIDLMLVGSIMGAYTVIKLKGLMGGGVK